MNSTDTSANMPNLPTEIWLELLRYLDWDGLKSLRQTCRWFYDLCDRYFYKNGEFVFYGNFNTNAEIALLGAWKSTAQNLKFVDVCLADVSILWFFRTQGANVRSLVFQNCRMLPGLLRKIILCCENLHSFHFETDRNTKFQSELEFIYRDFKALQKDRILRQYVSSFTFRFETDSFVTGENLSYFFAVFPNITELDLVCCCTSAEDAPVIDWAHSISFIYDQLRKMRHRLEKLRLIFRWDCFEVFSLDVIANIEMENLKMLSVNWFDSWKSSIMSHPHLLEHLTEFECEIGDQLSTSVAAFIGSLLNKATKLRVLTVLKYNTPTFQYPDRTMDIECFHAFLRSRLRSLNIDVFSEPDLPLLLWENYHHRNDTLRNLRFGSLASAKRDELFSLFIRYFCRLETMNINKNKCRFALAYSLAYQKNVHNLSLYHTSTDCLEFPQWLSRHNDLSRRFNSLTCLSLVEYAFSNLCEILLIQFEFPKLKSLAIVLKKDYCHGVNNDMSPFLQSFRKLTVLEYLQIDWEIGRTPLSLLALYKNLPKLRYLMYSNNCYVPFDELEYHCIFKECPTLCIFVHQVERDVHHRYVKYLDRNDEIVYDVVSFSPRSIPPRKLIYEGIPQKYPPCYWNNGTPEPARVYTPRAVPDLLGR